MSNNKMSADYKLLTGLYAEKVDKFFGVKNSLVEYNPGNCLLPPKFSDIAEKILDLEVKKDDVWMLSYPRTGSTWCQEMVWLIGNDLDFDGTRKTIQHLRAPILELSSLLVTENYNDFMKSYGDSVEYVKNYPSPRYIKTHLPLTLLPAQLDKIKPKIIYIARNPKDVCVSFYHYCQLIHNLDCTFEEFCDLFLNDKVPVGPIWPHYFGFWNKRHESNILFLKYEDMKKDLAAVIRQTAEFLEKRLSEEQVDVLCNYLDFSNIKNNRSVNAEPILEGRIGKDCPNTNSKSFIRKGQIGDWKNYMKKEMSNTFDEWIADNTKGTGLVF